LNEQTGTEKQPERGLALSTTVLYEDHSLASEAN